MNIVLVDYGNFTVEQNITTEEAEKLQRDRERKARNRRKKKEREAVLSAFTGTLFVIASVAGMFIYWIIVGY